MQQKKNECKEDKYSVPGEPNGFYPCTHQEVLQEQGVLHKLLPLRAFGELICWDDPCSLCFGSSGDAGWKISHLQFACDAALGPMCSLLICFVPHLPKAEGGGLCSPWAGWGLILGLQLPSTHWFTSTSPEAIPFLPNHCHCHVATWVHPAEQQQERIRGKKSPSMFPAAQMSLIHLLAMHREATRGSEHQTSRGDICEVVAE